jgi:hypothetical protein
MLEINTEGRVRNLEAAERGFQGVWMKKTTNNGFPSYPLPILLSHLDLHSPIHGINLPFNFDLKSVSSHRNYSSQYYPRFEVNLAHR